MRKMKCLVAAMLATMFTSVVWAADGDTFTAETVEGVTMSFKVISEADKTCQVSSNCIDWQYTGTVTVPATANGYTVTTIGRFAFNECKTTSIILSEGITTIADKGIYSAYYVVSITLPSTLTSIGSQAFELCEHLTSLTIPEGITTIPEKFVYQCDNLTTVEIPSTVTSIGARAFNANALTRVVMKGSTPPTVDESDDGNSFPYRSNITLVVPYGSLDTYQNNIYWQGFQAIDDLSIFTATTVEGVEMTFKRINEHNCQVGLGSGAPAIDGTYTGKVTIPERVNGLIVNTIADVALNGCAFTEIELPAYISYIGDNAVANCRSLTKITAHMATPPTIHDLAFSGQSYNATLFVDPGSIDAYKSADNWKLFPCIAPILSDPKAFVGVSDNKNYVIYKVISEQAKTCQVGLGNIDGLRAIDQSYTGSITIPATVNGYRVTEVADYAFLQTNVKTITLPEGLTKIGSYAFSQCYNLTSLVVPEGVAKVESYTFNNSSKLESVTLPSSLKSLSNFMFYGCSSLSSVNIPDDVTAIPRNSFYGCSALTNIILPSATTSIGSAAFFQTALESILLPSTVVSIGYNAFKNCNSLVTVYACMETPPDINVECFTNRTNATLYVPTVYKEAYEAKDYWKDFQISEELVAYTAEGVLMHFRITNEGNKTCEVAKGIRANNGAISYTDAIPTSYAGYVTIPSEVLGYTVTRIGPLAFSETGLTGVGIPNTVKSIGYNAFHSTEIPSMILPEGVTQIDKWAFYGCTQMVAAMLPSSLTSIGEEAFTNCTKLVFVSIPGNTTIGTGAFRGQSEELHPLIQSLMMGNPNPATYANQVGKAADATLYIPRGSKQTYLDAGWTGFKNIIETDMPSGGIKGDVNGDGKVTVSDAVGVVNILLGQ